MAGMTTPFPIIDIPDDAPEDIEQMGSKEKFWFRQDDDRWLFKFPREGTGEHWAEKVVAEVAELLGIPVARVELARFKHRQGSATLSFADRAEGRALIHGNELLASTVSGYDKNKKQRQTDHTLPRIVEAITLFMGKRRRRSALNVLAGYLLLDALVGNVDRHHENWGVVLDRKKDPENILWISPSFDHASSLGRELTPEKLAAHMASDQGVERYISKARGGIYLHENDARGAAPMHLVLSARKAYPQYFEAWKAPFIALDIHRVEGILSRMPDDWMRHDQKEFVLRVMRTTHRLLMEEWE